MCEENQDNLAQEELVTSEENTSTTLEEQEANTESDKTAEASDNSAPSVEEKLSSLQDTHLRLMAEYDNYRKRTLKEKSELIKNGGEKVLIDLLPVVDDLDLALQNIDLAQDLEAVKEGVRLIHTKFVEFLNRQGISAIPTENEAFNEELHEAIAVIPAPTEEQKGKIIDCVKKGYSLKDKVIRHANVVVGQ